VLTGGSSVMLGMVELGEEIFHMPVRMGIPKYAGAWPTWCSTRATPPPWACCWRAAQKKRGIQAAQTRTFKQVLGNMKSWFEKNF
jgi:cell division protein FtsA